MAVDRENTTVVDVTYLCNATCRYCRWGNSETPSRAHQELRNILLPKETLEALGTERIVLSGGEPRINPNLKIILEYYKSLVDDVILVTNGYGLDEASVSQLTKSGVTGITVSLDSVFPGETMLTRATPPALHAKIISMMYNSLSFSPCLMMDI
jgi:MoaA/NifB/PqqE/SkfB family radical SAM enzyme